MTETELAELLRANPDLTLTDNGGGKTQPTARYLYRVTPTEEEEQAAIVTWANANADRHPALHWLHHSPNGGYRTPATAAMLKRAGVKAGVPDLMLYWRNDDADRQGLAIEVKRADHSNHATAEQNAWIRHLRAQGWRCEICYGADQAIGVIKDYLSID